MAVKSPLTLRGSVSPLPATVQRKAAVWAASQTLTELPNADPEYQRRVLRQLLYALGLDTRPEGEPIEAVAS